MRWILRGVALLAILAGVAAVVLRTSAHTSMCAAVLPVPAASFIGTITAKDGADTVVRVDELDSDPLLTYPGWPRPDVGQELAIHYDRGDERLVHQGQSYHVSAYGTFPDDLHSTVHRAGECVYPQGIGTVHTDGSTIGSSFFSRDGIEPYRVPLGIAGLAVATIGLLITWRIRQRRRTAARDPVAVAAPSPSAAPSDGSPPDP